MNDTHPSIAVASDGDPISRRILRAIFLCPVLFFVHFVATMVFCIVSVRIVSQYAVMFAEKEVALPAATCGVISFSVAMASYWYVLILALVFIDAPLLFALQLLPRRHRWISHLYFNSVVCAVLLGIGWIVVVVSFPFSSMERQGRAALTKGTEVVYQRLCQCLGLA